VGADTVLTNSSLEAKLQTRVQEEVRVVVCSHTGFLAFGPEDGSDMFFPPKHRMDFNGLHGNVFQKIKLFVTG
jgi:hypothetical protein